LTAVNLQGLSGPIRDCQTRLKVCHASISFRYGPISVCQVAQCVTAARRRVVHVASAAGKNQFDDGETVKKLKAMVAVVAALMKSTAVGRDAAADPAPGGVLGESLDRGLGEVGSNKVELNLIGARLGFNS
jgi:hypothetical protein